MKDLNNLNDLHFDILKEIASIGSGNAVTSLAKMMGKKVEMVVPVVSMVEFKDITHFIGGPDNIVAGVLVSISGDINGIMMFLMTMESACDLISAVTGGMGVVDGVIDELGRSAFTEMGNILISAYIGSLGGLTKTRVIPSIPHISIDMANAILSVPAIEFGKVADKALFIESSFSVDNQNTSGFFIMVPDMPSFSKIMQTLGVE